MRLSATRAGHQSKAGQKGGKAKCDGVGQRGIAVRFSFFLPDRLCSVLCNLLKSGNVPGSCKRVVIAVAGGREAGRRGGGKEEAKKRRTMRPQRCTFALARSLSPLCGLCTMCCCCCCCGRC
jgi:hypothetical protein